MRGARPLRSDPSAGLPVLTAALALAVFGKLAYIGAFRLHARAAGVIVGGHWALDAASAVIGAVASLAALLALRAVVRRLRGARPGPPAG